MLNIQIPLKGQVMKNSRHDLLTPFSLGLGSLEIALKHPFKHQGIVKVLCG
jgi:hypothetical protein